MRKRKLLSLLMVVTLTATCLIGCGKKGDGSVGIEANGTEEAMEKFIQGVKASPSPAGHVTYLDVTDDPMIKERDTFEVTFGY